MARLLALEWDDREARVAVATVRNEQAVIEQAFTIALPASKGDTAAQDFGGKIGAALSARHIGRLASLVAVGRPSIELRNLSLPPAPDDDLPEMVRFQAMREFNALGDDWPLDFLPIAGSATEPRSVLAAAISPDLLGPIQATCEAAGLKPLRLVLRPCAAASLLRRLRPAETQRVRLLVDLLSDEADLTVLSGDHVVFLRTARLPHDTSGPEHTKALLSEIRRTSVAVQNRFGSRVEAIYLCGDAGEQAALAAQIGQELGVPAEVFDPFAGVQLTGELAERPPEQPGRFAPLLGMLLDEAAEVPPALDFLQPRHKPAAPSHRQKFALAGVIAAAVVFLLGLGCWWQLGRLEARVRELNLKSNALVSAEKQAAADEKKVKEIDKWAGGELVWLDELATLASRLPPAKDVLLTKLQWGPKAKELGGELTLQCLVHSSSTTEAVEQALRDARHRVDVAGGHEDPAKGYQWKFDSKVTIDPPNESADSRASATPSRPSAPAAPTSQAPDSTPPADGTQ